MNHPPQITVGICAKNSEDTIVECLKSLIKCHYDRKKLEIIVVDGKSTDKTLELTEKTLRDNQTSFKIMSDLGKGLGFARQLVLDNAKGEYICWVDADSYATRCLLENHAMFVSAHAKDSPPIGLAMALTLTKNRNAIARLQMYERLIPTLKSFEKRRTPPATMAGTITPVAALKKVGGFKSKFKGSREDVDLIGRLHYHNHVIAVNPTARIYHDMRRSWKEVMKQMRWYGRSEPRRQLRIVAADVLISFLTKAWAFQNFANYTDDPICFLLPAFSLFQHISYLIYYCSS